jgi:radical SAM superfamily enzyme YgiQ (UPF0313 family)
MDDTQLIKNRLQPAEAQRILIERDPNAMLMEPGGILPDTPEFRPGIPYFIDLYCKARCKFCSMSNDDFARLAKLRSVTSEEYDETIQEALRFFLAATKTLPKGRIILFGDDMFTDAEFLGKFVNTLYAAKEELKGWDFIANARPHTVVMNGKEEILSKMREIGFEFITLGIETFDPSFMRSMGKATTLDKNLTAIKMLNKAGINATMNYITFYPSATMGSIRLDLAEAINAHEKQGLYLALHQIMLAVHETAFSKEYADCIEYETVDTISGKKDIPKYIFPRDQDVRRVQDIMIKKYKEIQNALNEAVPNIIITRTFEALIYFNVLSKEIKEDRLAERYQNALQKYTELYPLEHRENLKKVLNSI